VKKEVVQQVVKTVQVGTEYIRATADDVLNVGKGAVRWIVKEGGAAVAAIGDKLVEVGKAVAEEFGKQIDKFTEPIKKLWDLIDRVKEFGANVDKMVKTVVE